MIIKILFTLLGLFCIYGGYKSWIEMIGIGWKIFGITGWIMSFSFCLYYIFWF